MLSKSRLERNTSASSWGPPSATLRFRILRLLGLLWFLKPSLLFFFYTQSHRKHFPAASKPRAGTQAPRRRRPSRTVLNFTTMPALSPTDGVQGTISSPITYHTTCVPKMSPQDRRTPAEGPALKHQLSSRIFIVVKNKLKINDMHRLSPSPHHSPSASSKSPYTAVGSQAIIPIQQMNRSINLIKSA